MDVKGGSVTGRYYTVIIVVYLIVYDNKEHGCYSVIVFIHNLTCTDGSPCYIPTTICHSCTDVKSGLYTDVKSFLLLIMS